MLHKWKSEHNILDTTFTEKMQKLRESKTEVLKFNDVFS